MAATRIRGASAGRLRPLLPWALACMTAAAGVLAAIACLAAGQTSQPATQPDTQPAPDSVAYDAYFYDLGTKQLFVDKAYRAPPFDTPSGKDMGVRAYVYGCGDCSDANRFIGYLMKYTDALKRKIDQPQGRGLQDTMDLDEFPHTLVRRVDGDKWEPAMSDEAMKITDIDSSRCPQGRLLIVCIPGKP